MNKRIASKTEGLITSTDYKRPNVRVAYWLLIAGLVVVSAFALIPLLYAFLAGFKSLEEFYSMTPTILPKSFSWDVITKVFKNLHFVRGFKNTALIFVGTWFCEVIIGGLAGYTISRLRPRGSRLLFKLLMWTMMMPMTTGMVVMFMTWTDFPVLHWNFQNTFVPMWIPSMCNIFNILLFKNFFDDIPDALVEAAKIDGATSIGIFAKVIVPLSVPIISTITVFTWNGVWNNFMAPFLYLKDKSLEPIALALYKTTTGWTEPEQLMAAFVVMIPSVIVFALCSKQILGNSTAAGVKG